MAEESSFADAIVNHSGSPTPTPELEQASSFADSVVRLSEPIPMSYEGMTGDYARSIGAMPSDTGIFDAIARGWRNVQMGFLNTLDKWGVDGAGDYRDELQALVNFNQERYNPEGANWLERGVQGVTEMVPTIAGTAALALTPIPGDELAGLSAMAQQVLRAKRVLRTGQVVSPAIIGTQFYGDYVDELTKASNGRLTPDQINGLAFLSSYGIQGALETLFPTEQLMGAVLGNTIKGVTGKLLKAEGGKDFVRAAGRNLFGVPFIGGLKGMAVNFPGELFEEYIQGIGDRAVKDFAAGKPLDYLQYIGDATQDAVDAIPTITLMVGTGAFMRGAREEQQRAQTMRDVGTPEAESKHWRMVDEVLYGKQQADGSFVIDTTAKQKELDTVQALTDLWSREQKAAKDAPQAAQLVVQIAKNLAVQERAAGNVNAMPWDYTDGLSIGFGDMALSDLNTLANMRVGGATADELYNFMLNASPRLANTLDSVYRRRETIRLRRENTYLQSKVKREMGNINPDAVLDGVTPEAIGGRIKNTVDTYGLLDPTDPKEERVRLIPASVVKAALGNRSLAAALMAKPMVISPFGWEGRLQVREDGSALLIPVRPKKGKWAKKPIVGAPAAEVAVEAQRLQQEADAVKARLERSLEQRQAPTPLPEDMHGPPVQGSAARLAGVEQETLRRAEETATDPNTEHMESIRENQRLRRTLLNLGGFGAHWENIPDAVVPEKPPVWKLAEMPKTLPPYVDVEAEAANIIYGMEVAGITEVEDQLVALQNAAKAAGVEVKDNTNAQAIARQIAEAKVKARTAEDARPDEPEQLTLLQDRDALTGLYVRDRALMIYFRNADAGTFIHEWLHHVTTNNLMPSAVERALVNAYGTDEDRKLHRIATVKAHEDVANGLLAYIRDGTLPDRVDGGIIKAFEYLKGVMQASYDTLGAYDSKEQLQVPGSIADLFGNLLSDAVPDEAQQIAGDAAADSMRNNPPSQSEMTAEEAVVEFLGGLAQTKSVTPEQDAAYLKAVEAGDMETAQRMVDEAARAAGYNSPKVFHGSPDPSFTRFKYRGGMGGRLGYWFATDKRAAINFARERYSGIMPGIVDAYLAIQNPAEYRGWAEFVDAVNAGRMGKDISERVEAHRRSLMRKGYDGVIIRDSDTDGGIVRDDYVAFDASQIKSADPITRDDKGNVIPLSARFNPESPSILYQKKSKAPPGVDAASKQKTRAFYARLNQQAIKNAAMLGYNIESLYDLGIDSTGNFNNDLYQTRLKELDRVRRGQARQTRAVRRVLAKESELVKDAEKDIAAIRGEVEPLPDSLEELLEQTRGGPKAHYWLLKLAKAGKTAWTSMTEWFSTLDTISDLFSLNREDAAFNRAFSKATRRDTNIRDAILDRIASTDAKKLAGINPWDQVMLGGREHFITHAFAMYSVADGRKVSETEAQLLARVEAQFENGSPINERDRKLYALLKSNSIGRYKVTVDAINDSVDLINSDSKLKGIVEHTQNTMETEGRQFLDAVLKTVYETERGVEKREGLYMAFIREGGVSEHLEMFENLGTTGFNKGAPLPLYAKERTLLDGKPISLDYFGNYNRYLSTMVNAGVRLPTVIKQLKILNDPALERLMTRKFGGDSDGLGHVRKGLWSGLKDKVRGTMKISGRVEPQGYWDNMLRERVRIPTSVATLALKPWIVASQYLSTVTAWSDIPVLPSLKLMGDALRHVTAQRYRDSVESIEKIRRGETVVPNDLPLAGYEPFERYAAKIPSLRKMFAEWELLEAQVRQPNTADKVARRLGIGHKWIDAAFREFRIADQINKFVIGASAYEAKLMQLQKEGVVASIAEEKAADYADSVIRDHVPVADNTMRAAFHNAPEVVRLLMPFASQPITYFNTLQRKYMLPFISAYRLAQGGQIDKLKAAFGSQASVEQLRRTFFMFVLPAILWNTLQRRRLPDEDELIGDLLFYPLSMVPLAGDVAQQVRLSMDYGGGPYGGDLRVPGMIPYYDAARMGKAINRFYQAAMGEEIDWSAQWKDAIALPADLMALPKYLANAPAQIMRINAETEDQAERVQRAMWYIFLGGDPLAAPDE